MSEKIKKPRENPDVDSRLSFEEEQSQIDLLKRSGIGIDWTSGTIRAKNFIGGGTGLWDVGEGTGTGPKGDKGDQGIQGEKGDQGIQGERGLKGDKGDKGDTGSTGQDGADVNPVQLDKIQADILVNTAGISQNASDINAEKVRNNEQDIKIEANEDAIATKAPQATTYTKTEVDASQEAQDDKITKNKTDIAKNKSDITSNSNAIGAVSTRVTAAENDIIELEEEIEALAPSFDRGHWEHDPVEGMAARAPIEGAYYLAGNATQIVQMFEETHQIYFNNIDSEDPAQTHTFDDVTEGMYIEMFEGLDSSFLLGVVETVTKGSSHTVIDVTVVKAEGGPGDEDDTVVSGQSVRAGVRVKFFNLAEGELNLDGYMQTSGGTFTGDVIFTKEIHTKPAGTNQFVNLKTFPSKNPDTDEWDYTSAFGVNVDLDHGNTLSNSFKFSNRYGDILTVNGGTGPGAKYEGRITDDKHLVTKEYVDSKAGSGGGLITLATPGGGFSYVSSSSSPPSMGQFSANDSSTANNTNWHFYNMYDNNNLSVMCKDYEKTDTTMLEIWNKGSLRVRTTLKAWQTSSRSPTCMQAICSGGKPSTALGATLAGGSYYDIIITNLRKK